MKRPTSPFTQPQPLEPDWIALLTCVKDRRGERRNFWAVRRTGNYRYDNHIGVGIAREVLHAMRQRGTLGLLNQIIHDMIAGGKFGGVEAGFLGALDAVLRGGRILP